MVAAVSPLDTARVEQVDQDLIGRTLAGDAAAVRVLVQVLMPVIQARVVRVLARVAGHARGRNVRQELEDLCQEVFVTLFRADGKVLRSWDPARGMSLTSFVGLVAERRALQVFRSGKQSPWTEDPTEAAALDRATRPDASPEGSVAARQLFDRLLDELTLRLSPLGMTMFQALLVEQRPVAEVAAEHGMTTQAVYAWQGRLRKQVKELARQLGEGGTP